MRKPFRTMFLTVSASLCLAAIFYATTITATTDPSVRPLAAAMAVALLAMLILHGLITVDRADKGLLASVLSLLPRIFRWGQLSGQRAFFLSLFLLIIGGFSVWLGPIGIRLVSISCDDASSVEVSARSSGQKCNKAISENIWLSPIQRYRSLQLKCFDGRGNEWPGELVNNSIGQCGARPIDASYVSNGIIAPDYDLNTSVGRRSKEGLQRLNKALLSAGFPDRRHKDVLLFATWNIRDFGRNFSGYGERLEESYAYIAEVISHFDIIAVQEVRDPEALAKLMKYLGDDYRSEFGLVAPGVAGGNEQLGFIYDSRKIALGDISTTIVLGRGSIEHTRTGQPSRPPFVAEFVSNERRFLIATTHIYFGATSGPGFERRIKELETIATELDRSAEKYFSDRPMIIAGDLNVAEPHGREMAALTQNGFETDPVLASMASNYADTRPYDQIMVRADKLKRLAFGKVGVFKVLDHVFREDDWNLYKVDISRGDKEGRLSGNDPESYYRRFRTYQISDHHVKWAEFRVDW